MTEAASDSALAKIVEWYVAKWLRGSDLGRSILDRFPFEEAMDHVFELLNVGFLKITGIPDAFTGIEICIPPQPPCGRICRPTFRQLAERTARSPRVLH